MSIPKSVEKQGQRADELLAAQNKPNPPDPNVTPPPDPGTPPSDPNAPPVTPPEPAPSVVPPVTPPAAPPEPDYSKEAYLTLQGKYNAEVPRLYSEIADLKIRMAEMVQSHVAPAPPAPAPPEDEPASIKYMRKELPEFEGAVTFLATKIADEKLAAKLKEIDGRVGQVEATTTETAGNIFYKYLDDNVKNWRAINNDPGFLNWLSQQDRYTGAQKSQLLQGAYNRFDGITVANFFSDYVKEKSPATPPAAPPAPDITKFVATPPGTTTPPAAPPPEETMSRGDVKKFYDDVAAGKFRFKPDDMKKTEEKINRLSLAGKII